MARARLKLPMRPLLEDHLPENQVHALWNRVEAARKRQFGSRPSTWFVASFAATLAAASAAVFVFGLDRALKPGALRLSDGHELPAAIEARASSTVALDDGSSLLVSRSSRLDVLKSTGDTFVLALREGAAEFEVHPGGPRVWRIECARIVIEVVGTHFTVSRTPESLSVAVQRGTVLVRGDAVPDGVVRLGAGQSVVVPLGPSAAASATAATPSAPRVEAAETRAQAPPPKSSPLPSVTFDETTPSTVTSSKVDHAGYTSANAVDSRSTETSDRAIVRLPDPASKDVVNQLMADADSLRRKGRFRDAATVLEQVVASHGSDPRASLAEFTLGRLYIDSLDNAVVAGAHFSRALGQGLPVALAEDARARLVEAYAREGNRAAAAAAAMEYRARYPNGRQSGDVDRWARGAF